MLMYVGKMVGIGSSNSIFQGALSREIKELFKRQCSNHAFVPKHTPCEDWAINQLQEFIDKSRKIFVITGAGISTESGIPDYRSEGVGLYATSDKRPIQLKTFMDSAKARQSYWARNYIGWPRFSSFQPNKTHFTLADWERRGKIQCVVTQNVDRLHHKAGNERMHELHGTAFNVICTNCTRMIDRYSYQTRLIAANPHMLSRSTEIRPDGDVELDQEEVNQFKVPPCKSCGGIMKPYIVFFGDNVPKKRVETIKEELASSDSLLVLGSSLYVYSGYRFILQAVEMGIPMCAVNIGTTRADKHLDFRISARCGEVLPQILI